MAASVIELNLPGAEPLRRDLTVTRLHDGTFTVGAWVPLSMSKLAWAAGSSLELQRRTAKWLVLHLGEASFDVSNSEARQIADRFHIPFPVLPAPVEASSLPSPSASAVAGAFSRT